MISNWSGQKSVVSYQPDTPKKNTLKQTKRLPFKDRHNDGLLCIAWLWTGLSKSQIQLSLK